MDTIEQLREGFYRIGTLDRGGWERWFLNSTQKETSKLLRNLEFVQNFQEGLSNVTKPFFLFPYAFISSKSQLQYILASNYSDSKMMSRRSTLHISDECFALFGVSYAFQAESVYRQKINDGLLMLLQSGLVKKIKNDVRWDMIRSSTGQLQQISEEKTLKMTNQQERGLTLADTEGMFLLLGVGFLIAGGVLISEWVGGCTNKCMTFMKIRKARKAEENRIEEQEIHRMEQVDQEIARIESENIARMALESASSAIGISFMAGTNDEEQPLETKDEVEIKDEIEIKGEADSLSSSRRSKHSRTSSALLEMNAATLYEMFEGPKTRPSNIICINGKIMSENEASKYASDSKRDAHEKETQKALEKFDFLNDMEAEGGVQNVCQVEINLQAPSDDGPNEALNKD